MTTVGGLQIQTLQQQALYDMMNGDEVSGAAGVPGAGGTDDSTPPLYLTPQALMTYCQTRLQNIGSQVQTAMTQQQNANWESNSIGNILEEIAGDTNSLAAGKCMDDSSGGVTKIEQDMENLISEIQEKDPDCPQLASLMQLHDTIMATGTGPFPPNSTVQGYYCSSTTGGKPDGHTAPDNSPSSDSQFSTADLTAFTDSLDNINNSLGQNGQLNMIKVESLMSDQTTAITLTTSIIQSIDDGTQKIADKIGT
ncbi:MAG TPA: hypothetical protein VHS09_15750 [Polyangiaceae bacterium]|jgi:hypothetical protein|nr:hypothetical protein [Polyangiaceae bacterium]